MKKINILLLTICSCISPFLLNGQEITLEQCREMALKNNNAMAIAARNKEKAGFTAKAYKANYLPKISATGNYLYSNTEMKETIQGNYLPTYVPDPATGQLVPNLLVGADGNPVIGQDGNPIFNQYAYFPDLNLSLQTKNTWMAGIRAEQPIYTGGKITSAYRMAQIGDEIAGLNEQLSHAEIIVKADEAYWTYVKTQELVKLAHSYQRVVTALLQDMNNALEVGMAHRNDLLKVQVKANEAELQLRQATNGNRLARKNLCYVMGLPLDSEITTTESFGMFTDDYSSATSHGGTNGSTSATSHGQTLPDASYTARPEYTMLQQQILLKDQEIKLTRSDFLPNIGVAAHYGYMSGLAFNGYKLLNGASFSALVSVSIPLFQWGEGRNKIRAAQTEREIARLYRDDVVQLMELELAQAADKCDESVLDVQLTTRSLQQAEENMRVSEDRFKAGLETLTNFLEAQTVWQQAWKEYVDAVSRMQLNQTYYLKAAGKLF